MKRSFCDICDRQVTEENNGQSISFQTERIAVSITATGLEDLCKYCVIDAVVAQDDRGPKAPEGEPV